MSGLLSAADAVQLGPPTLRSICPIGAPKVRQFEKRLHRSNSAARGQDCVLCGTVKAAELSKTHLWFIPKWRTTSNIRPFATRV